MQYAARPGYSVAAERGMTADLMALWMLLVIVLAIAGAWRLK
jgi:hypothetical protein